MTTFVLLPGMDGSGILFSDFAAALGTKSIVVSYPKDRPLTYEQLESLVESALPADEPYILLGESFSGPIAIRLASKNSPMCRAVILVCTFAKLRREGQPKFISALFGWIPFWLLPVSIGAAGLLGRFDSPKLRSKLAEAIAGVAPAVWRLRLRSVLDVDVTLQLGRIRVPVLYLRASEDRVVPLLAAEIISRIAPNSKRVTIEGPHALLQTKPEECARVIQEFVRQAEPQTDRA